MASHEGAGGQVEDQTAIHLLVEVEVEVVEAPLWVAKLGLRGPSLQQAIAAMSEFVRDQAGEEVDRGDGFGLEIGGDGFRSCCFFAFAQGVAYTDEGSCLSSESTSPSLILVGQFSGDPHWPVLGGR